MIAEDLHKFDIKNIFIMPPIKNTLITNGLFHKLLYSNNLFTSNGLYIKIDYNDTKYVNGRLYYNIDTNICTIDTIDSIEKYILGKINNSNKKIYQKINDQLRSGNIKLNNNVSSVILKISGLWENDNSIGISYKILSYNNSINLQD